MSRPLWNLTHPRTGLPSVNPTIQCIETLCHSDQTPTPHPGAVVNAELARAKSVACSPNPQPARAGFTATWQENDITQFSVRLGMPESAMSSVGGLVVATAVHRHHRAALSRAAVAAGTDALLCWPTSQLLATRDASFSRGAARGCAGPEVCGSGRHHFGR